MMDQMSPAPASGEPPASSGEKMGFARWAIVGLLLGAIIVLAFGVGFGASQLLDDDDENANAGTIVINGQEIDPEQLAGSSTSGDDATDLTVVDEVINILGEDFFDQARVDPELLRDGAIEGILNTLNDPHTIFIPADQNAIGAGDIAASYEGIGASVADDQGQIIITQPFPGSPAEEAGIKPGDAILEVNGESTEGWTTTQAVLTIRGPRGTEVTLLVEHADGTQETITIVRSDIDIKSVFYPCEGTASDGCTEVTAYGADFVDAEGQPVTDIGYMWINQYHEKTPAELDQALAWMKDNGYDKVILDLRLNPGGYLRETVETTDEFIDEGIIIGQVDRDGNETFANATEGGDGRDLEVVILQDENSASGSEVMAAALRDNGFAKIVGETSFGKGTVNHLRELSDGSALYVSIARWLTPEGDQIEGIGIKPDIEVDGQLEQIVAGEVTTDPIYQRAVEYLRTGQ
jgi:carboxyl-terminal processing protease